MEENLGVNAVVATEDGKEINIKDSKRVEIGRVKVPQKQVEKSNDKITKEEDGMIV